MLFLLSMQHITLQSSCLRFDVVIYEKVLFLLRNLVVKRRKIYCSIILILQSKQSYKPSCSSKIMLHSYCPIQMYSRYSCSLLPVSSWIAPTFNQYQHLFFCQYFKINMDYLNCLYEGLNQLLIVIFVSKLELMFLQFWCLLQIFLMFSQYVLNSSI